MSLITMSQNELNRLEAIQKIRAHRLSVIQAAELLRISRSQVHRPMIAPAPMVLCPRSAADRAIDATLTIFAIMCSIWCARTMWISGLHLLARSWLSSTRLPSAKRHCANDRSRHLGLTT